MKLSIKRVFNEYSINFLSQIQNIEYYKVTCTMLLYKFDLKNSIGTLLEYSQSFYLFALKNDAVPKKMARNGKRTKKIHRRKKPRTSDYVIIRARESINGLIMKTNICEKKSSFCAHLRNSAPIEVLSESKMADARRARTLLRDLPKTTRKPHNSRIEID